LFAADIGLSEMQLSLFRSEGERHPAVVRTLRRAHLDQAKGETHGRQAEVVARLRERIEQRFRRREPAQAYAASIGVSQTALRQACVQVAGTSPAAMLDARAVLEASRLLLYTKLSVIEIAWSVGFEDPAYFSRFFTRHTGRPPGVYRISRGG
jgi:AraC family transcriptional activator of pobA